METSGKIDEAIDALGHQHRRSLLLALREHNPQDATGLTDSNGKARSRSGTADDAVSSQVSLYHTHLPKLESCGFIRWDRDDDVIVKGPAWDDLEPFLAVLDDRTGAVAAGKA